MKIKQMKDLKKIVKTYVDHISYLDDIESGAKTQTLQQVLKFNEKFKRNMFYLEKAMTEKYGFIFENNCSSEAQDKLNELCDIENNKRLKKTSP